MTVCYFAVSKDAGWNSIVPPNGFINRPKTVANNDNPDGLSTATSEIGIEPTPAHLNLVSGDLDCATWVHTHDDPDCSAGGGAGGLPHRYSFGSGSASRHMLHVDEWCELIDMPTNTLILTEIFGSANFTLGGAGSDSAMPGAIEYQGLHSDNMRSELESVA